MFTVEAHTLFARCDTPKATVSEETGKEPFQQEQFDNICQAANTEPKLHSIE